MNTPASVKKASEAYAEATDALNAFTEEHKEIIEEFYRLVGLRNVLCTKVRDLVKRHECSFGEFSYIAAKSLEFDMDKLRESVPKSVFQKITKRVIDKDAIDVLIDRGELEESVLSGTYDVKYSKRCKGPSTWKLG